MVLFSPHYDVIIAGLGPVGAIAAHLLASEGLSVLAVDPAVQPYDKPRAIGIDHESLRILQQIGIADLLEPHMGAYGPSEYRSAKGELLQRIVPQPEPFPLAWPPYNTFVQPELEKILRAKFADRPKLDVQLGWRLAEFDQDDQMVHALIEQDGGGERREVTARYIIGCDGAWSPVRESVGLKLEDLEFDEPWLVVDVLINEEAQLPPSIVQYCDAARPATFIRGPGNLCRWEIMLLDDENPADMTRDDRVWELLARWITPEQGRIWRAATYRFHALVADRWHEGRAFIAGDAAHQTPPFMAQGLNQGIRDVGNLCWKIAHVLRGAASPALLDSYDQERRPNARAVIELTKVLGQRICEKDPVKAAERDAKMLADMEAGRGEIIRQQLLPPLHSGLLATAGGATFSPAVGTSFPQPWVKAENGARVRMDELLPRGFLLFAGAGWQPTPGELRLARLMQVEMVSADGHSSDFLSIQDEEALISSWMYQHGISAALVRPDHVVFGTARDGQGILDLLNALRQALAIPHVTEADLLS